MFWDVFVVQGLEVFSAIVVPPGSPGYLERPGPRGNARCLDQVKEDRVRGSAGRPGASDGSEIRAKKPRTMSSLTELDGGGR